jgi:hypothetical protein
MDSEYKMLIDLGHPILGLFLTQNNRCLGDAEIFYLDRWLI